MSKNDGWYAPAEAQEAGIELLQPVPLPSKCQFCGKTLYHQGFKHPFKNKIQFWTQNPERCICAKAAEYWNNYEAEKEKKRHEEEETVRRAEFRTKVEKLFAQSRLGDRFLTRTFETFITNNDNQAAYDTAYKYASEFERFKKDGVGLIFNGKYGTGKTHLAAAIAIYLLNKGIPVIIGTTIKLLGKLKQTYNDEIRESEEQILDLYSEADLLIIDDLGKERVNEWVLEKLYYIINNRYENNLPTIVTTNYEIDTLPVRLSTKQNMDTGEAIASRLWEMCRGVEMNFEDWRKR